MIHPHPHRLMRRLLLASMALLATCTPALLPAQTAARLDSADVRASYVQGAITGTLTYLERAMAEIAAGDSAAAQADLRQARGRVRATRTHVLILRAILAGDTVPADSAPPVLGVPVDSAPAVPPAPVDIELVVGDSVQLKAPTTSTASKTTSGAASSVAPTTVRVQMGASGSYTTVAVPGSPTFDPRQIADSTVVLLNGEFTAHLAKRSNDTYIKVVSGGAYPSVTYHFSTAGLGTGGAKPQYADLVFEGMHAQLGAIRGTVNADNSAATASSAWLSSDPAIVSVTSKGIATARDTGDAIVTYGTAAARDSFHIHSVPSTTPTGGSADTTVSSEPLPPPLPTGPGELVLYPDSNIAFILGPQLKAGSSANPWPWFDENEIAKGLEHGEAFPSSGGIKDISGTLTPIPGNRKTFRGKGTKLVSELTGAPALYVWNPTEHDYNVFYGPQVIDDSTVTVNAKAYVHPDLGGAAKAMEKGFASDGYINRQYYDLGLALYVAYYRTGNPQLLVYARKVTDSWWESAGILGGKSLIATSYSPRNSSLGGLMLRALDGHPEMWPWITDYVRQMYSMWVGKRIDRESLYFGVRDGGYMLLYATWLAKVHPDPAVRAEMREDALTAARDYYARLQKENGAWYWKDDAVSSLGNEEEPFMVGLLLDGMIAAHRLTGDPAIAQAIVKSVDHLWSIYRKDVPVPSKPGVMWRAVPYFDFPDGSMSAEKDLAGGTDTNTIREGRQRNSLVVQAFGYAYQLTHDVKYRQEGDEIFAATYGKGRGPLTDAYYGLGDFREKEYNQSYRSAGRYLAWRWED